MKREIRVDRALRRQSYLSLIVFPLVIGGPLLWALGGGDKSPAYPTVITTACLLGFASIAPIVISFVYYCCPKCKRKISPVKKAEPAIHHYCPDCNIEWDSGWSYSRFY